MNAIPAHWGRSLLYKWGLRINKHSEPEHVSQRYCCATAAIAGSETVTQKVIDDTLEWLSVSTEEERRARLIEPDRSEVLAAGVLILRETLRHLALDAITASTRDLLNGVALEAAALPAPVEGDAPPGAYTCC